MSAQEPRNSNPASTTTTISVTLEPIRSRHRDALDTHDVPALGEIDVSELAMVWENDLHQTKILRGQELSDQQLTIPPGATIASACFTINANPETRPEHLTIRPPHTIETPALPLAERLIEWATKRHFLAEQKVAKVAAALMIAALSALLCDADCEEDDDDDIYQERTVLNSGQQIPVPA